DLTAVVTVSDDGGSSGRLRSDLDMPPPGDLRNCLVALAEAEPLMENLFQHRFPAHGANLDGHSLGNLIIAGMSEITGDFLEAIKAVSRVLAVRGRVLPTANQALVLKATLADGRVVRGETAITASRSTIVSIEVEPADVQPLPEVLEAMWDADIIIVGPGSVYSSLLPNLLVPGMAEALTNAPAIKIFVCNVMTQPGESDHFTASRHLQAVLEQFPYKNPFHYAIVNLQRPPQEVMAVYEGNGQQFVEPDLARLLALGTAPVTGSMLQEAHLARHDPEKLARCILERVAADIRWPELLRRRKK
ncbi:MAG TPA: uridine diphosphate-N-acetylglucosamine-binding protein YvcK, partial [Armatimonadota bacterium]